MVHVALKTSTWHNHDADDDDGPWSYRGTTNGTVDRVYIARTDYDRSFEGMDTELEPPFWVVYATYMTGDTFGSDWRAEIVGVFKHEDEAKELAREAQGFKGFGSLSNGYHVPWNGYFETLLEIQVERVP